LTAFVNLVEYTQSAVDDLFFIRHWDNFGIE